MASASTEHTNSVTLETKIGSVRGIPSALMGWIVVAGIAAFMTWQTTVTVNTKLDKIIDISQRQLVVMEKLVDRLPALFK